MENNYLRRTATVIFLLVDLELETALKAINEMGLTVLTSQREPEFKNGFGDPVTAADRKAQEAG